MTLQTVMAIGMVLTFVAAVVTMLLGVVGLGRSTDASQHSPRSAKLMFLRVALCLALLGQIILYISLFKS